MTALDRLEELEEFLTNFPDSKLRPAILSEIEMLKKYLSDHGIARFDE